MEAVKPKRRNSEQRKEKSRDAARSRRSQETQIFSDLAHELPISSSLLSQLDKASIIRLAITQLKLRHMLATEADDESKDSSVSAELKQKLNQQYYKALDGFLIVIAKNGDVVYVSENVEKYLGLTQVDLLGYSIMDFAHPCDHEDVYELLNDKSCMAVSDASLALVNDMLVTKHRTLFIRVKCTLTSKGRNINVKSAAYRVIHFTGNVGYRLPTLDLLDLSGGSASMSECAILVGRPMLNALNGELALSKWTFVSRHTLDLKFVYCDQGLCHLLGYSQSELVGKSLFSFHHALDAEMLDKTFRALLSKGQAATGLYRFLTKHGGYVWMETSAALTGDENGERRERYVICVNYTVSNIEDRDTVFASIQLQDESAADDTSDGVVIEEDSNEVVIYEEDEDDDNLAGMQFVTEKIVTEQVISNKSNTVDSTCTKVCPVSVVLAVNGTTAASGALSPAVDRSPMLATGSTDVVLEADGELNCSNGSLRTLSGNSLSNFFNDLESGIQLRAPYIPMDDLTFVSNVVSVDPAAEQCPLGLDLSTVPGSSTLAVDSTSLLLASVDSAVSADTHSIVVKRSAEHEEALSGGNVSPACKVLKLADSIPMAAADRVKPVPTAASSSSVLLNLLTTGIDTNWGYKLKDCLAQPTVEDEGDGGCGSSSGSGIVFVSLLQNLITGEPGSSEDQVRRSVDGVIFTTD